jgi:hypothetical protein
VVPLGGGLCRLSSAPSMARGLPMPRVQWKRKLDDGQGSAPMFGMPAANLAGSTVAAPQPAACSSIASSSRLQNLPRSLTVSLSAAGMPCTTRCSGYESEMDSPYSEIPCPDCSARAVPEDGRRIMLPAACHRPAWPDDPVFSGFPLSRE